MRKRMVSIHGYIYTLAKDLHRAPLTSSLRGLVVLNGVTVGGSQSVLGHVYLIERRGSKKWQRSICKEEEKRREKEKTRQLERGTSINL